ncbi:hypothetical protein H8959_014008 [Pygathrix nigripes]
MMFIAPLDMKFPSTSSRTCMRQVSCPSAHECAMFQWSGVREKPRRVSHVGVECICKSLSQMQCKAPGTEAPLPVQPERPPRWGCDLLGVLRSSSSCRPGVPQGAVRTPPKWSTCWLPCHPLPLAPQISFCPLARATVELVSSGTGRPSRCRGCFCGGHRRTVVVTVAHVHPWRRHHICGHSSPDGLTLSLRIPAITWQCPLKILFKKSVAYKAASGSCDCEKSSDRGVGQGSMLCAWPRLAAVSAGETFRDPSVWVVLLRCHILGVELPEWRGFSPFSRGSFVIGVGLVFLPSLTDVHSTPACGLTAWGQDAAGVGCVNRIWASRRKLQVSRQRLPRWPCLGSPHPGKASVGEQGHSLMPPPGWLSSSVVPVLGLRARKSPFCLRARKSPFCLLPGVSVPSTGEQREALVSQHTVCTCPLALPALCVGPSLARCVAA